MGSPRATLLDRQLIPANGVLGHFMIAVLLWLERAGGTDIALAFRMSRTSRALNAIRC